MVGGAEDARYTTRPKSPICGSRGAVQSNRVHQRDFDMRYRPTGAPFPFPSPDRPRAVKSHHFCDPFRHIISCSVTAEVRRFHLHRRPAGKYRQYLGREYPSKINYTSSQMRCVRTLTCSSFRACITMLYSITHVIPH